MGFEDINQKEFEGFMMQYKPEFRDFNKVGDFTYSNPLTSIAYDAYLAGQQSKQAEIDALKSKIDDLAKWAEFHIKDYNSSESESEHDRGWFNAACQVFKTLKGNKNDA